ncbi:ABC transporter substrate-binding protein [Halomicrobium salinisoli]|uniref:ABC transporter substrate-binding protein n=1 Tax=Halomicrobium salinisoli TaxID=2878391 RepID=UPI001CEFDE43|nr:ABC transporter substrate-binding protein [Halomicrobium salinisoli]
MDWGRNEPAGSRTTRRRVLATLGGSVAASGLAGCLDSSDDGAGAGTPAESVDDITIGLATATSGAYIDVGEEERRGFELAVQHLNEGGGFQESGTFGVLKSRPGVEGVDVETVAVDTTGSADTAASNAAPLLEDGEVDALFGGVAGDVAATLRDLSAEHGVPYFPGTATLSSMAGEGCSPHTYREMYPATALVRALAPAVVDHVGEDSGTYYKLNAEAPEGQDLSDVVTDYFNRDGAADWQGFGSASVRRGTTDYGSRLARAGTTNPSALFCNLFGLDAVNVLSQAGEYLDEDTTLVFPLLTPSVVEAAAEWNGDVFGTIPWHGAIDGELSDVFDSTYQDAYGDQAPGSAAGTGVAHLVYGSVFVYAAAVERADSTDADAVRSELEGSAHDLGLGREQLQACNHQATRPVPVVRVSGGQLEPVDLVDDAVAGCDEPPASDCSLE